MRCDLSLLEKIQCLRWDLQTFLHSSGENNNFGAVIEQFLEVRGLNPGQMIGAGLLPVPFTRSAGKKLCILVRLGFSLDLEVPPGNVFDSRRAVVIFPTSNIARRQPRG